MQLRHAEQQLSEQTAVVPNDDELQLQQLRFRPAPDELQ